ncbi:MAG TPA: beta-ketoacyl synthase N-terminal-like domain-containing protein, partial [Kouleothrix sp.]|nr:beta-ketoacyl synthase N-terminal-like domain-containing protein [Kouleothrix sp.]
MRRVVITGLGAVTPVGNDAPATWQALLRGTSGIGLITRFDPSALPIRIAGEVKNFVLDPQIDAREARRQSLYTRYALNAVVEAVRAARLDMAQENPEQVGVIYGSGAAGLDLIFDNH